jgi:uncharacterized protein (DUF1778 family)
MTSRDDDLIVEAAGYLDISVSEFMLNSALGEAEKIVEEHRAIRLEPASYWKFLSILDRSAEPSRQLVKQVRASRSIKHVD